MYVVKNQKVVVLDVANPHRVLNSIPTAKPFKLKGKYFVGVPHRPDEVRVLRNLGIPAPASISYHYDWPGRFKPFAHQHKTAAFLTLHRKCIVLNEIGTGKTLSALWAADYLLEVGAVKKVLIMSPLSTLERVWGDAIFLGFPKRRHVVLHGTAAKRSKLLRTDADFYIINHDGFRIIADEADGMFDLIIVDEAAVLRNPSTSRFKAFNQFMRTNGHARLWLMTGTPTPNEPTDAWALAKLIDSPNVPKTYGMFKNQVMIKISQYAWAPRPEATDIVLQTLQPAVRYTRDECFDLPPTTEQRRQVKMTAEQTEAYKIMVKELVVETKQKTITAANEAIKMQKLVQIACGIAYAENGEEVQLDCKPRIAAVREVIEEAGQKIIVFAPLTSILGMLDRELSKHWSTAIINGAVPAAKRNAIFRAFQEDADPRVLIAHPATMSHGLTLTAASTIIWYGPITSNEVYVQANGRIERVGKTQSSNVVHIQACEVEALMYSRLRKKQKMQGLLLDLIKNGTL